MPGIGRKTVYIQKDGTFLTYTRNCEQKAMIGIVKSTLKIPPRHNAVIVQSKSKNTQLKDIWHILLSNEDSIKGKDPNINTINGTHNIKGKTSANILVLNYTNKHVNFNKGEYIGLLEPTMEEIPQTTENPDVLTTHNITTERMTLEKVEPDTIKPPHHKLKQHIETRLTSIIKGI